LLGSISEIDGGLGTGSTHLLMGTEDGWEELGVNASRLLIFQLVSDISGHSEVRILIDTLWDQARNVSSVSEDVGE